MDGKRDMDKCVPALASWELCCVLAEDLSAGRCACMSSKAATVI